MLREGSSATAWAEVEHRLRSRNWHNDCLMFVRMCFNVAKRESSAEKGFYATHHRHTSWPPPAGAPVWWTNGRYGHVATSSGGGSCWTTDFLRSGCIDKVKIASITAGWGAHYRGWSEDINGVIVYVTPVVEAKPNLDASLITAAARTHGQPHWGLLLKHAVAAEAGRGDMNLSSPVLGNGFKLQYARVQRSYLRSIGAPVTDTAADGIPGQASLTWLGLRHGFTVSS